MLDLRVSITGGVHFDLVKRVLRDINRSGQAPEEIIQQVGGWDWPASCGCPAGQLWAGRQAGVFGIAGGASSEMAWRHAGRSLTPCLLALATAASTAHLDTFLLTPRCRRSVTPCTPCTRPSSSQTSRWVGVSDGAVSCCCRTTACCCDCLQRGSSSACGLLLQRGCPLPASKQPLVPAPSPRPAGRPPAHLQHLQPLLRLHEPHLHPQVGQPRVQGGRGGGAQGARRAVSLLLAFRNTVDSPRCFVSKKTWWRCSRCAQGWRCIGVVCCSTHCWLSTLCCLQENAAAVLQVHRVRTSGQAPPQGWPGRLVRSGRTRARWLGSRTELSASPAAAAAAPACLPNACPSAPPCLLRAARLHGQAAGKRNVRHLPGERTHLMQGCAVKACQQCTSLQAFGNACLRPFAGCTALPTDLPCHSFLRPVPPPAGAAWRGSRDVPVVAAHAVPRRTLQPHV